MSTDIVRACFIENSRGRIFLTLRVPQQGATQAVLVVPPFAEEMNKSRKMVSDVAMELAMRGMATLLPDLYGTGDSEGEFAEADWTVWQDDLARAAAWSAMQGYSVTALLCVRTGCLLGADAMRSGSLAGIRRTVWWQPVMDGQRYVTQFLRLRTVASMMEQDRKETVDQLRQLWRANQRVEVAGYEISSDLARQLDELRMESVVDQKLGRISWFEIARQAQPELSGSAKQILQRLQSRGFDVQNAIVVGEPFWTSTEIVRVPELVRRTVDTLTERIAYE